MHLEHHCIIQTQYSGKTVRFSSKYGSFILPQADLLAYRKQKPLRIRSSALGDGMQVVLQYDRTEGDIPLDLDMVQRGMCVYTQYNEESNSQETYLYAYPGGPDGIARLNAFFRAKNAPIHIVQDHGFVRVEHNPFLRQPVIETIGDALGFLVGICIGYGKPLSFVSNKCVAWQVRLPIVGSIPLFEPLRNTAITLLQEIGIFIGQSVQKTRYGSLLQWTIHDTEFLSYVLGIWEGGQGGLCADSSEISAIRAFCATEHIPVYSVLKLLAK